MRRYSMGGLFTISGKQADGLRLSRGWARKSAYGVRIHGQMLRFTRKAMTHFRSRLHRDHGRLRYGTNASSNTESSTMEWHPHPSGIQRQIQAQGWRHRCRRRWCSTADIVVAARSVTRPWRPYLIGPTLRWLEQG